MHNKLWIVAVAMFAAAGVIFAFGQGVIAKENGTLEKLAHTIYATPTPEGIQETYSPKKDEVKFVRIGEPFQTQDGKTWVIRYDYLSNNWPNAEPYEDEEKIVILTRVMPEGTNNGHNPTVLTCIPWYEFEDLTVDEDMRTAEWKFRVTKVHVPGKIVDLHYAWYERTWP